MPLTIIPTKPLFTGTAPNRLTQAQSEFSANADNMMQYMSVEPTSQNEVTTAMNALAGEVEDIGASAVSAADSAAADSNFKGNWSDLTGALSKPASVYHNFSYWKLLNDLADVTLSEPTSANADWAISYSELNTIARSLNLQNADVMRETDTTAIVEIIYSQSQQVIYNVPVVAIGKFIDNINIDQLTTTDASVYTLIVAPASAEIKQNADNIAINTEDIIANDAVSSVVGAYMAYGGTADAITLTSINKAPSLTNTIGAQYRYRATATNTGAATVDVDGLGIITLKTVTGVDLPPGYQRTDVDTVITFDGTYYIADRDVEIGSNVDGIFTRYADGRMNVSYSELSVVYGSAGPAVGGLFLSPLKTFIYPAQFLDVHEGGIVGYVKATAVWPGCNLQATSWDTWVFRAESFTSASVGEVLLNASGTWY